MPVTIQTLTKKAIKFLYGNKLQEGALQEGVCYGISMLANDAILQGPRGIIEFTARFELLERYCGGPSCFDLLKAIEQVKNKQDPGNTLSQEDRLLSEMPDFLKKIWLIQD